MEICSEIQVEQKQSEGNSSVLNSVEEKRLTDLFSILIAIDQRIKGKEAVDNEK